MKMELPTRESLKPLFEPKSVALIGASHKLHKVGGALARNALSSSFSGQIYPVNPNLKTLFGHRVYRDLNEVPEVVDLVEIAVPGSAVPRVLLEAAQKGVKAAIIVSSGFAEIGNFELQEELAKISHRYGIRILGPNCFGLINTAVGLDLTFSFTQAIKGSISFISQSGAMCCGTLDYAFQKGIGFSKFINLGNKCDVDEADALIYLSEDPQTKAIALYIEGIRDGRRFMAAAKEASKNKPIIGIKAGLTEAGARAALSHTGSLANRKELVDAAFLQSGVVRVDDIEDLIGGALALAWQPPPRGTRIGIITNAGGLGVTVADWCQILDLKVPVFSEEMRSKLRAVLPEIAATANPVDMTGDADFDRYKAVSQILLESEEVDLLIAIFTSQGLVTSYGPAQAISETANKTRKPVLAMLMGGSSIEQGRRILIQNEIPVYHFPEKIAIAAKALTQLRSLRRHSSDK
ncbi:CoA-binding protein [Candidatus Bathyarchaeota archaeon]|nr:CoA-binding protein [Candidatus Bathyarchaeota archaeon]